MYTSFDQYIFAGQPWEPLHEETSILLTFELYSGHIPEIIQISVMIEFLKRLNLLVHSFSILKEKCGSYKIIYTSRRFITFYVLYFKQYPQKSILTTTHFYLVSFYHYYYYYLFANRFLLSLSQNCWYLFFGCSAEIF